MRHSSGLLPTQESVKLFFLKKRWSKVGVRLKHGAAFTRAVYVRNLHLWHTKTENNYRINQQLLKKPRQIKARKNKVSFQ